MLLSFVIPAFNVAPYIKDCINSILSQIEDDGKVEVIIIDDGSIDETFSIVNDLMGHLKNIKLKTQTNQGVSVARNEGVLISEGDFIVFLDADDKIEPNTLKKLLMAINHTLSDMIILGYKKINSDNKCLYRTSYENYSDDNFFELKTYYATIGENDFFADTNRCWGIAYRSECLKKLNNPFPVGVPYLEDAAFLAKFFMVMESYSLLNLCFCSRLMREGSAVNSDLFVTNKSINGFNLAIIDIDKFRNSSELNKIFGKDRIIHLNQTLIKFITLRIISAMNSKSMNLIKSTISDSTIKKVPFNLNGVRYPFNFWGRLYKTSVFLFIGMFFFQSRFRFALSRLKKV